MLQKLATWTCDEHPSQTDPRPLKLLTGKETGAIIAEHFWLWSQRLKMNIVRGVLCWMVTAFLPVSVMAADSGAGMVRPYGTAWLNGTEVEQSSAIFPGDLVQTSSSSALKIRSSGSSVTVLPESLVEFEGSAVRVEHGGVNLVTSKGMFARAGAFTATPASSAWTQFELTEVDGTVQIVALKGDLQISDGSRTTTLLQGQAATQRDSNETQSKLYQSGTTPSARNEEEDRDGDRDHHHHHHHCREDHCFGNEHCHKHISPICP
jgi:hypothetical protein